MLGQCSSLAKLNLSCNGIDDDGIAMLRACWPGGSGLKIDHQFDEDEEEASDMGDGSYQESRQESEEEDSGPESEEED